MGENGLISPIYLKNVKSEYQALKEPKKEIMKKKLKVKRQSIDGKSEYLSQ